MFQQLLSYRGGNTLLSQKGREGLSKIVELQLCILALLGALMRVPFILL